MKAVRAKSGQSSQNHVVSMAGAIQRAEVTTMARWQLQEAKARLSELVRRVASEGPQEITVHGETAVVVVSQQEYLRLTRAGTGLVEFIRSSPLHGVELDIERNAEPPREVRL